MTAKLIARSALMILVLGAFAATLSAQQLELYPNAGGFLPHRVNFGDMRSHLEEEGIYGLKGGVFLNPNVQLEGSFGYINHFEPRDTPAPIDSSFGIMPRTIYGLLFDINGAWNFRQRQFFGKTVTPYVAAGGGGLTAEVRHTDAALLAGSFYTTDPSTGAPVLSNSRTITLHDGATFFAVNYGGGIKALNLWGPMGFRADVRGRTLPNFYGKEMSWPEITGGLTFAWGER